MPLPAGGLEGPVPISEVSPPGEEVSVVLLWEAVGAAFSVEPEADVAAAPLPLLACDSSAALLCIELHAARDAAHANAKSHLDIDFS